MQFLVETSKKTISFILQPRNYNQLYMKLTKILSKDQYCFFACPDVLSSTSRWSTELELVSGEPIKSFDEMDNNDKDIIADYIEDMQADISAILSKHPEFKDIYEKLFLLPATADIKVVQTVSGIRPVLTQWGCKSNTVKVAINSLSIVANRPRENRGRVVLDVFYSNGTPAADKVLYLDAKGKEISVKTNDAGKCDLGRMVFGREFSVYDKKDGARVYEHPFTAVKDGVYRVELPLIVSGIVKVIDQRGDIVKDFSLYAQHQDDRQLINSGASGTVQLDYLEAGKTLQLSAEQNPENEKQYTIAETNNAFVFQVDRAIPSRVNLLVINQDGEPQVNKNITIESNGQQKEYFSDEQGNIPLDTFSINDIFRAIETSRIDNHQQYAIVEDEHRFEFTVETHPPQFVKVKLINHKNNPLPNVPIDFKARQLEKTEVTSKDEAICILPQEPFVDREKVKAVVHLTEVDKKGNKKERVVKKSFTYKAEQSDYVIKIKKFNRLWLWLLLLLLPLLLLIKCEKRVIVKAVHADNGKEIADVPVHFDYNYHYVYDDGELLPETPDNRVVTTNSQGVAAFDTLKYSVYSYIFEHFEPAHVYASTTCYSSDTLDLKYHGLFNNDTVYLPLGHRTTQLDFKVIDKDDQEPLPDAMVYLESEINGNVYKDSVKSSADGRVVFDKVPVCGKINIALATKYGYLPDSITHTSIDSLTGHIDSTRTLQLTPLRETIVFYVTNCETGEAIPGAKATITLTREGKSSSITAITNVNGVGKGVYDSARVLASIMIEAEKEFYKPGRLRKAHLVRDFINLSDAERTICLEPTENQVQFKTVDEATGDPLPARNSIVIEHANGKTTRLEQISNRDGHFNVELKIGDVISIVSSYPPDYEDNNTKVLKKDGIALLKGPEEDRVIPLKPKMVTLKFRTINADNGALLNNASLNITVNGSRVDPSNSGNGEFTVTALYSASISIVASKRCHTTNSTSIRNKRIETLALADQSARDIPMRSQIKARLGICYNVGRPVFRVYVDDHPPFDFDATTGREDSRWTFREINIGLTSGRHTFRFVRIQERGRPSCGSDNRLEIPCAGIVKYFPGNQAQDAEFTFVVDIP